MHGKLFVMHFYSLEVGGLLLTVRKTDRGWEAAIAGSVIDETTAKSLAVRCASQVIGRQVENVRWEGVPDEAETPEIEVSDNPFFSPRHR